MISRCKFCGAVGSLDMPEDQSDAGAGEVIVECQNCGNYDTFLIETDPDEIERIENHALDMAKKDENGVW